MTSRIRAVMALGPGGRWGVWRQPQWMAEVRRNVAAAGWVKLHFDLDEPVYGQLGQLETQWAGLPAVELARWLEARGGRLVGPGPRSGLDGPDITNSCDGVLERSSQPTNHQDETGTEDAKDYA